MDFGIEGKVALVTAATRGIGLGIAHALAREGARVSVVARTESDVRKVAESIRGFGVAADVTTEEGCSKAFAETQGNLGPVEILISSTACSSASGVTSVPAPARRGVTPAPASLPQRSRATWWSARA